MSFEYHLYKRNKNKWQKFVHAIYGLDRELDNVSFAKCKQAPTPRPAGADQAPCFVLSLSLSLFISSDSSAQRQTSSEQASSAPGPAMTSDHVIRLSSWILACD